MKNKTSIYKDTWQSFGWAIRKKTWLFLSTPKQAAEHCCTNCEGLHNRTWDEKQLKLQEHLLCYFQSFESCMSTTYPHTEPKFSGQLEKRWLFYSVSPLLDSTEQGSMQGEWNRRSDQLQTCPDWGLLSQLCSHHDSYNTVFCPPDSEGPFKKNSGFTQNLCVFIFFFKLERNWFQATRLYNERKVGGEKRTCVWNGKCSCQEETQR